MFILISSYKLLLCLNTTLKSCGLKKTTVFVFFHLSRIEKQTLFTPVRFSVMCRVTKF